MLSLVVFGGAFLLGIPVCLLLDRLPSLIMHRCGSAWCERGCEGYCITWERPGSLPAEEKETP